MKIQELDEGILDFVFGDKEKELKDDPEYKGWLKMYTKNQDVAAMHKRHEEFLKYYKAGQSQ
jgi:protein associated with RNAse G/E